MLPLAAVVEFGKRNIIAIVLHYLILTVGVCIALSNRGTYDVVSSYEQHYKESMNNVYVT